MCRYIQNAHKMSRAGRGDFGYDSAAPTYYDDPNRREYRDNPFQRGNSRPGAGYQGSDYDSFNELTDTISSNIFTINSNATTLERAINDIGTSKDCVQLRDRIHTTEQKTNQVISSTINSLHRLATVCRKADRAQKLQHERLTSEFRDKIQRYNTFQKKVAEKVKTSVILSSQKPQKLVDLGDEEFGDEERLLQNEQRRAQMMVEDEAIEQEVALLQEREHQIRQLESDVIDINEIFRDLGTMVHEQGEVIDSIENNVTQAADNVEGGRDQLEKAASYQRKARKKMCCLVLILLIIAGVIALVIALSIKH